MDFDTFARMLLARLDVDDPRTSITPTTGLYDDVGLDSFQAFELLIVIETAAGLDVPPADLPVILTMGDAYSYYQQSVAMSAHEPT
jgi:acyl carrier protein